MRTRHQNKLAMYLAVCRCAKLPGYQRARRRVPAFREAWDAFQSVMESILSQWQRAELDTEGATESKASLREELATAAARVSAGLVTWAEVNGEIELARKAYVTRSSLLNGRAIEAAIRAETLLALAREHVSQLRDYGITASRLDAFETLTAQFAEASGRPRSMILERKLARVALTRLFAEADQLLARIDRLTSLLGESQEPFVEAYRASRRIVRMPAGRETSKEAEVAIAG